MIRPNRRASLTPTFEHLYAVMTDEGEMVELTDDPQVAARAAERVPGHEPCMWLCTQDPVSEGSRMMYSLPLKVTV